MMSFLEISIGTQRSYALQYSTFINTLNVSSGSWTYKEEADTSSRLSLAGGSVHSGMNLVHGEN